MVRAGPGASCVAAHCLRQLGDLCVVANARSAGRRDQGCLRVVGDVRVVAYANALHVARGVSPRRLLSRSILYAKHV